MRARLCAFAVIGFAAAMGGCSSSTSPSSNTLTFVGRLERGATVQALVVSGTDTVAGTSLTLTATPTSAATIGSDGTVTFVQTGSVTIQAQLPNGKTIERVVTVAVPPTVVFDIAIGGNRAVYRAALDGEDLTRLSTGGADNVNPSAACGTVVFSSFRNGQADLYSVPLAGGTELRLTTLSGNETDPALSPNGQRLAFVRDSGGVGRVWVGAGNATGVVRLSAETNPSPEASPAWSGDGRLVFTTTGGGNANLALASAATPPVISLLTAANSPSAEVEGSWSANSASVAFVSTRSGSPALHLVNVASGVVTPIPQAGSVAQPAWLEDGRIVFAVLQDGHWTLAWIDPADTTVVHTIPLPAGDPQHPSGASCRS